MKLKCKIKWNQIKSVIIASICLFNILRVVYIWLKKPPFAIGILVILEPETEKEYSRALDSLRCYAQIHNYHLNVAYYDKYIKQCRQKDIIFRRHCIVKEYLPYYEYLLFLDPDIGVVNPKRKIEEFIDPAYDVTFYEKLYNQDIMTGSYLLKNTTYAMDFIKNFANYGINSLKLSDTQAINGYLVSKLFQDRPEEYQACLDVLNSTAYDNILVYQSCMRTVLGVRENYPHVRILRKNTGWARDYWPTNSQWSPERDFMIHLWRQPTDIVYDVVTQANVVKEGEEDYDRPQGDWYDPIDGKFDLGRCYFWNTTWNYDPNYIATAESIEILLRDYRVQFLRDYYRRVAKIHRIYTRRKQINGL